MRANSFFSLSLSLSWGTCSCWFDCSKHLWRNRLARSAVNRKVAGSSPARCEQTLFFLSLSLSLSLSHGELACDGKPLKESGFKLNLLVIGSELFSCWFDCGKHLWRNRLARSAVNRKVAGSSPARCEQTLFFFLSLSLSHGELACDSKPLRI